MARDAGTNRAALALKPVLRESPARVVVHVLAHGPTRQTDIQRALGWTPTRISKAVSTAVGMGFLQRTEGEPDGAGRPSPVLSLTADAPRRVRIICDRLRGQHDALDALLRRHAAP